MASDLSFNIVALDQAGATFIRLAEQVDHLSEKLDRLDHKDVTATVNVKTDESTKALDSFSNRFALLTGAIVAGSPVAGAAILGGIGASFIGIAALAEKSNADVQASYKNLWSSVVSIAKQGSDPLVANFVSSANAMEAEAQKLAPQLQQAFSYAGPDLVALTRGVDDFADRSMPGITAAAANSLPVFQGVASAADALGQSVGQSLSSASQYSTQYGVVISSLGQVAGSVLTGVVSLVNDVAVVWAQNSGPIVADVRQIIGVVTDLGQGALPIVSSGVAVVAATIHDLLSILGPVAPILGTVGGVALTTWAAFKTAGLVTAGVNSLAMSVVSLGGEMEAGAAKAAAQAAALQGVAVESSTTAVAVRAAGAATATASLQVGAGLSAIAGPLGIMAAVTLGVLTLGSAMSSSGNDSLQLSGGMDGVTAALQRSHGAFDQAAQDALKADPAYKAASDSASQLGISQDTLFAAITKGGPALDDLRSKVAASGEAGWHAIPAYQALVTNFSDMRIGAGGTIEAIDGQGRAAQNLAPQLDALAHQFGISTAVAADSAAKQDSASAALSTSSGYAEAAAGTASLLGLSLAQVTTGYQGVISAGGVANATVAGTSEAFLKNTLAVAQSATEMQDHFVQADRQVAQSSQAVADAQHGVAQAAQSVADAQHGVEQAERGVVDAQQGVANAAHAVEQAQRSLGDAYAGVTTAEQNYTRAQESAREAQDSLNKAREQAIQDLKDLQLQMQDQVLTEEQAAVKLFDAQTTAAAAGVTPDNAKDIASQDVTAGNEAQMKVAFDLISAQNALNNAQNNGVKLREQVTAAEKAGVDGASGVVSAQKALRSAQDQVASSATALTKAHQSVQDAEYGVQQAELGLQKAHQQVTDAGWALQKAHLGVRDAQYQQTRASQQLTQASLQLRDAQDQSSRSLDIHTAAGQRNIQMILQMWDSLTKSGLPIQDQYRQAIDNVAGAFGISRDKASDYLKQLGLIPKDFQYSVTAITQVDRNNFDSWLKGVLSTGGYAMDSRNQQKTIGGTGYAGGGYTGDGGKWDPAGIVHKGEWVVPQEQVHPGTMPLLQAINQGLVRGGDGAAMLGYAGGGLVDAAAKSVYMGANLGAAYLATSNARGVMGFPAMPALPKYDPASAIVGLAGVAVSGARGSNRNIVLETWKQFGWTSPAEIAATDYLLMRESGYNNLAQNPTSTAFGMFQFLNSTWAGYGVPKTADPALQALGGGRYISSRYGDPLGAAAHERALNWYGVGGLVKKPAAYDNGGPLMPGWSTVFNGTGAPENVRTSAQEDQLLAELRGIRKALGKAGNTYNMPIHNARNQEMDLQAQMRRMEITAGIL
jgi:hypothetical protein